MTEAARSPTRAELEGGVVRNIALYSAELPPHAQPMSRKQLQNYDAKLKQTKGFDVDGCPGNMPGRIVPIYEETREWKVAERAALFSALDCENLKNGPMKSITLIKATQQPVAGILYFLTFRGLQFGNIEATYQSKVWLDINRKFPSRSFTKVPGTETIVGKKRKPPSPSLRLSTSAFFTFVRSLRERSPGMTFAQARRKGSLLWNNLTDSEKSRLVRGAKRKLKDRVLSAGAIEDTSTDAIASASAGTIMRVGLEEED